MITWVNVIKRLTDTIDIKREKYRFILYKISTIDQSERKTELVQVHFKYQIKCSGNQMRLEGSAVFPISSIKSIQIIIKEPLPTNTPLVS